MKNKPAGRLTVNSSSGDDPLVVKKGFSGRDVVTALKSLQGSMTQREFATLIGVSQSYLWAVLLEKVAPGKKILDYLDLEHGYIKKSERAA